MLGFLRRPVFTGQRTSRTSPTNIYFGATDVRSGIEALKGAMARWANSKHQLQQRKLTKNSLLAS